MRKSLIMFAACVPFYGAVGASMGLVAGQFPEGGVRPFDWALLFALGVVVPFLQSVYLVRALDRLPITDRIRWMAIWPSAMTSVALLVAITMIWRALAMS